MTTHATLSESLADHQWRLESELKRLSVVAQEDDDDAFERSTHKIASLRKRIQEIKTAIASGQA
jgi:anti-sigma28 factor (negative regulator of flagellin synthesis)